MAGALTYNPLPPPARVDSPLTQTGRQERQITAADENGLDHPTPARSSMMGRTFNRR